MGLIFPQVELIKLFLITDEEYDDFDDEEEEKKDEETGKTSLYLFFHIFRPKL